MMEEEEEECAGNVYVFSCAEVCYTDVVPAEPTSRLEAAAAGNDADEVRRIVGLGERADHEDEGVLRAAMVACARDHAEAALALVQAGSDGEGWRVTKFYLYHLIDHRHGDEPPRLCIVNSQYCRIVNCACGAGALATLRALSDKYEAVRDTCARMVQTFETTARRSGHPEVAHWLVERFDAARATR